MVNLIRIGNSHISVYKKEGEGREQGVGGDVMIREAFNCSLTFWREIRSSKENKDPHYIKWDTDLKNLLWKSIRKTSMNILKLDNLYRNLSDRIGQAYMDTRPSP